MSNALSPIPYETPIVQSAKELLAQPWYLWLFELSQRLQNSARVVKVVSLTAQSAAIATTPLPLGALSNGFYRLSYYLRITTPATTSSSATVTLSWTESGVACAQTFAAVTGNTTTTLQSGTILVRADGASPLSYAVAYASVGATAMQFRIDVVAEQVA